MGILALSLLLAADPEILAANNYIAKVVTPHKGRAFVVNFWASWCDPCREEMANLLAASSAKKIDLVLVSLDVPSTADAAVDFLKAHKIAQPLLMVGPGDPDDFIAVVDKQWEGTIPYTLVYNQAGAISKRMTGGKTRAQFDAALQVK